MGAQHDGEGGTPPKGHALFVTYFLVLLLHGLYIRRRAMPIKRGSLPDPGDRLRLPLARQLHHDVGAALGRG